MDPAIQLLKFGFGLDLSFLCTEFTCWLRSVWCFAVVLSTGFALVLYWWKREYFVNRNFVSDAVVRS